MLRSRAVGSLVGSATLLVGLLIGGAPAGAATLTVSTTALPTGAVGLAYSTALVAQGGVAPYSWSIAPGSLPSGLSLSPAGVLSGTSSMKFAKSLKFVVSDAEVPAKPITKSLTLTIAVPAVATTTLPAAAIGQPYSTTLTTTGGVAPLTWSLSTGALPAGLHLDAGAGVITGTPTAIGTKSFSVKVSDSSIPAFTATKALRIAVAKLVITSTTVPVAVVGLPYATTLIAAGGTGPYSWKATMPAGLHLAADGAVTGTPTKVAASTVSVTVTDSTVPTRLSTHLSIKFVVAKLAITTATLPDPNEGQPYSHTLAALGGTAPYAWSSTGILPAGLALNAATGAISGTPLSVGRWTFTVNVTDSTAPTRLTGSLAIAITVDVPPVTGLSVTATSGSSVSLSWLNPAGLALTAILVCHDSSGAVKLAPADCTDPTVLNGAPQTFADIGLAGDTTYTYSVFVEDVGGAFSAPASAAATTSAGTTSPPLGMVTAIAAGPQHTCALIAGGTVDCWGFNGDGALGDGTTTNRLNPVPVPGLSAVTALSAGSKDTCALVSGGTVKCWGYNLDGELGDGTTTGELHPVPVSGLSSVVAISAGADHTCALISGGTVKCWGYNGNGQLGDGSTTNRSTPVPVAALTSVIAIASGYHHTCALISGGTVKCWGLNQYGELGDKTTTNRLNPVAVPGLTSVTALVAGAWHTCALISGGTVKCWGNNVMGQLGDGSITNRHSPVAVSGLTSVTELAAGVYHSCALISGGSAKCWGFNGDGELGDGTGVTSKIPVPVADLSSATAISSGDYQVCTLMTGDTVKCWGYNGNGQLGNGTAITELTPVTVLS